MNYYPVGIYTGMRRGVGSRRVIEVTATAIRWHPLNRPKEIQTQSMGDFRTWLELGNCIYEGGA